MAPQKAQKQATRRFKDTADQPTMSRHVWRMDCGSDAMWFLQDAAIPSRLLALLREIEDKR
jgi:hypothetical protein